MVIAWRIYHLTKLGREIPDVPCTVFFEEAEWKALVAYKTKKSHTTKEDSNSQGSYANGCQPGGLPGKKIRWRTGHKIIMARLTAT